jgi:PAS domain S-box-containing protein
MRSALLVAALLALCSIVLVLVFRLRDLRRRVQLGALEMSDLEGQLGRAFGAEHIRRFSWDLDADLIRTDGSADGSGVRGSDVLQAIHPDDRDRMRSAIERVRRGDTQLLEEVRFRATPDGMWATYLASARRIREHGAATARLGGIAIDLSSARQLERESRESEHRFYALAESMPQIVYITGSSGRIEYVNHQWKAYTGLDSAESDVLLHVVHPDDHALLAEAWRIALSNGDELTAEFRLKRASDGAYNWFLTRAIPVKDVTGDILRWYGTSTDIQDVRAARAQLEVADRKKDEFLATLAHELRNPLAPIRNAIAVMQRSTTQAEVPWAVELIDRQTRQMIRLIDDLMDVSRISAGLLTLERTEISLAEVIREALEQQAGRLSASAHTVHFDLARDITVLADRARIVQVFANLVNNAVKYSDGGTPIEVSLGREDAWAVVRVVDHGIGLAPAQVHSIFEMFVQVKDALHRSGGGLGIGLSLVRQLVELHGGTVSAESAGVGHGSTFTVRLPMTVAVPGTDFAAPPAPAAQAPLRVLLVDDGEDALSSMATLLSARGATVETACRGATVVPTAAAFQPDVIILDISLPDVDGYEVCRRVRNEPWGASVAIIALTGWGTSDDRAKAAAAGFDRHVVKPAHPDDLIRLSHELRRNGSE